MGHVEVMNRFQCLAAGTVHAFDLIAYVPVIVLLRKIRRSAI